MKRLRAAVLAVIIFVAALWPRETHAQTGNVWYGCQLHLDYATGTHVVRRQCHTYAMPREHRHRVGWKITRTRLSAHVEHSIRWPTFYVPPPPQPPLTGFPPLVARWTQYIYDAAHLTELPARFIAAVVMVESSGIPTVSSQGADGADIGLMQFGPSEAAQVGGAYTYDPAGNIRTGALILAYMYRGCGGYNLFATAAHYNAGCGGFNGGYASAVWNWYV